ncbi:MAG: hypothetical protein POELPBGB_01549 [Bacteroidia bacterium]|nr:hypothetical protein [Bacteroidia bacterium]
MKKRHLFPLIISVINVSLIYAQDYQWAKNISSDSGFGINPSGVAADNAGNVFIAGYFSQEVDFDPGAGTANLTPVGSYDIYFAKYDAAGNYLWAKSIGSDMTDMCFAMTLDASGNVIISGYYGNSTDFDPGNGTANLSFSGSEDAFIAKYSTDGNYIWAKGFGGIGLEQISDVAVDAQGNIYLAGYFEQVVDFDPGNGTTSLTVIGGGPTASNLFFAKYDASGNFTWVKQIPTSTSQICIAANASGNVFIAGSFVGFSGNPVDFDPGNGTANITAAGAGDIFFARYDTNGNYVFAKGMGGSSIQGGLDKATGIDADNNDNVYLCGIFGQTTDFDPGSGTANLTAAWSGDMFFAKYNSNGDYLWAHNFQSDDYNTLRILLVNNSDIILSGGFAATTDFDPGNGTANLTSTGDQDIFFARYDNNGAYLSAVGIGNIYATDYAVGVTSDNNGNVIVNGVFTDSTDFDPGTGRAMLYTPVSFGQDVFIAKYTEGPVGIHENNTSSLLVHPNPSTGIFTVNTNAGLLLDYTVSDIAGRIIVSGTLENQQSTIDLSQTGSGLYFMKTENQIFKLIKQ